MTIEHIPPQNLFPKPRKSTLIKVKSCKLCNSGTSKDDEYFRLMLTMMDGLEKNPIVLSNQDTVIRSLARKEAEGLLISIIKDMNHIPAFTTSGLYIGEKHNYLIDDRRLNETAKKIVKGLFFHEFKKPVPSDYNVYAYSDLTIQGSGNSSILELIETVKKLTCHEKEIVVVENGFSYSFHKPFPEETDESYWILKFYNRVIFTGFVIKNTCTI